MFNQKEYDDLLYKYMNDFNYKKLSTIFQLQIMEREKDRFLKGGNINE